MAVLSRTVSHILLFLDSPRLFTRLFAYVCINKSTAANGVSPLFTKTQQGVWPMKKFISILFISLAALNLLDMAITTWLIAKFGVAAEMNTFVVAMWKTSPLLFVGYKSLASVGLLYVALQKKRFHNWWAAIVAVPLVGYLCVVVWSVAQVLLYLS
jgi:hypothetical protein